MIQLTIEEYEQIAQQRLALMQYIRRDFDSSKDWIYQSGLIDKADGLNLPKDFIEFLRKDLDVGK